MNLIKAQNISIGYGKKIIQSNLNLQANKGELICLIGTNGAGKSTLLRSLVGLQPLINGDVIINNKFIKKLNNHERAKLFALVLTDNINIENTTIFDLVSMGRFPYTNWSGMLSQDDIEIINQSIKDVNLFTKKDCKINEISDGEKQRAIIAKALAQDTPLILLDEPTAHLDLPNRIEIMMLLRRLSVSTQKTFILSTHELDLAIQMSDNIWLMTKQGIDVGIPEDLMLTEKFQKAFGSNNYYFDQYDGHCHIKQLKGTLSINLQSSNSTLKQKIWLERALIRIGIEVDNTSNIIINCSDNGFTLNQEPIIYFNIESILNRIKQL